MINTTFIPRDAGFFSVFNFYVGTLYKGVRSYPYFNKQVFLNINNGNNQHFCYWTDSENCWFDYFQPVKFNDDDVIHLTNEYKTFPIDVGFNAPEEFRIPEKTKNLILSPDFIEWRKRIHEVYSKYVKFHPNILHIVDTFWSYNINDSSNVIGIHYRHPSHFVESGKIYLDSYFNQVDQILSSNPESKIFLASDSSFGVYAFLERYGNKVCYFPEIDRITMSEFLEWAFSLSEGKPDHVGFVNGKGYELHHKRIGKNNHQMTYDLLCEVLCLSKCSQLIHTTSNIALALSYINPHLKLISI